MRPAAASVLRGIRAKPDGKHCMAPEGAFQDSFIGRRRGGWAQCISSGVKTLIQSCSAYFNGILQRVCRWVSGRADNG